MKYMLLMVGVEREHPAAGPVASEPAESGQRPDSDEPCWMPWFREMTERGVTFHDSAQLLPARTATTVELVGGEVLLSDGPFAETKEQILGYDVIDVADLDEAVYVASRHPVATNGGRIEVRPILAI